MVNTMSDWSLMANFPGPSSRSLAAKVRSINDKQRLAAYDRRISGLQLGDHILDLAHSPVEVKFHMNASPINQHIQLVMRLSPSTGEGTGSSKQQEDIDRRERITVRFSAHCEDGETVHRTPTPFTKNLESDSDAPTGRHNFSNQINHLQCGIRANVHHPTSSLPGTPHNQYQVSFKSRGCSKFSFTRPVPTAAQRAARAFKDMMDDFVTGEKHLVVIMDKTGNFLQNTWPRFASMPQAAGASNWPWLGPTSFTEPSKMIDTSKDFELELDTRWVATALKLSGPGHDDKLSDLPPVERFMNGREYATHILGSFAYESYASRRSRRLNFDGNHICDIQPDTVCKTGYLIMLHISPSVKVAAMDDDAEDQAKVATTEALESLPENGERVLIDITLDSKFGLESWHGKVISMPDALRSRGFNTAVYAFRPQTPGERDMTSRRLEARFTFGHAGPSVRGLYETVFNHMIVPPGARNATEADFWRNVLLAQEPGATFNHVEPAAGLLEKIRRDYIIPAGLNGEQAAAVIAYFSQRITLIAGPPGTGKSTVIDLIVRIEQDLKHTFWVTADSNAAVDVLTTKFIERHRNANMDQTYRIRPAFEEAMMNNERMGGMSGLANLPGFTPLNTGMPSSAQRMRQVGAYAKSLSLGEAISIRAKEAKGGALRNTYYRDELHDLQRLDKASQEYMGAGDSSLTVGRDANQHTELKQKETTAFQSLTRKYVNCAKGLFSTASAASNPVMQSISPTALIIDEGSQMVEARAAHVILHAVGGGKLQRVLIVGDPKQLPPTLIAERNPFRKTAEMSLFERLMNAEIHVCQLRVSYRGHPQITSIYNQLIYNSSLVDAQNTKERRELAVFAGCVRRRLLPYGHPYTRSDARPVHSLVVSAVPSRRFSHFGSEQRPASKSRINFQTAAIAMNIVHRLLKDFKASDILITAFYRDQVNILKALLATSHPDLTICTVDGSQGKENKVQIIDCVVLGGRGKVGGASDTLGFLNTDNRRFNVAMSRGQVGRIVIGHELMGFKTVKDPNPQNVWARFMKAERDLDHIIQGGELQALTNGDIADTFAKVMRQYNSMDSPRTPAATALNRAVADAETRYTSRPAPPRLRNDVAVAVLEMMELCGCNPTDAREYLAAAKGDLHEAVHRYGKDRPGVRSSRQ